MEFQIEARRTGDIRNTCRRGCEHNMTSTTGYLEIYYSLAYFLLFFYYFMMKLRFVSKKLTLCNFNVLIKVWWVNLKNDGKTVFSYIICHFSSMTDLSSEKYIYFIGYRYSRHQQGQVWVILLFSSMARALDFYSRGC